MAKARNCDCEYKGIDTPRMCLYHWGWAKLIDDARAAMVGNEQWIKLASEVPRPQNFPLHERLSQGKGN
jgi:hypothetical protein